MTTWRLFGPLILPYWRRMVLALLVSILGSLTDLLRPWPLKIIVDNVVSSKHHHHQQFIESLVIALAGHDRTWLLLASVALVLLVAAVGGLCDFAQTLWMSEAGQRVVFALLASQSPPSLFPPPPPPPPPHQAGLTPGPAQGGRSHGRGPGDLRGHAA